MKPVTTVDHQIETLRRHGVMFSLRSEDDARAFLTNNTYFFKIKSYEKNYRKDARGDDYTYANLEFEYLVELSLIDFSLSRLIWSLCANIEHAIKVDLNTMLMGVADPQIGKRCVARSFPDGFVTPHDNPYTNDLRDKCGADFAVWHIWELASFHDQVLLYNTTYDVVKGSTNPYRHILFIAVKIRNAVSHGNCLMTDLSRPSPSKQRSNRSDIEVTRAAMDMCGRAVRSGKQISAFQRSLDSLVVHNFAAVLLMHLRYVKSVGVIQHCQQEVAGFIERVERHHQDYFGEKGVQSPRNMLVNNTLTALVTLAKGYLTKSEERLAQLSS